MYHSIKHLTKQKQPSGIKFIEIPLDASIPWNSISSYLPSDQWRKVENPEEIDKMLTSRNKAHLSQSEGTPFTMALLKDMLGLDSFAPFGKQPPLIKTPKTLLYKLVKGIRFTWVPHFPSHFSCRHDYRYPQVERKYQYIPIAKTPRSLQILFGLR